MACEDITAPREGCRVSSGAVYGLGLIGALVYYWQHADGFWAHVWAVVEAILWPAFLVYHLLGHIAT